MAEKECSKCNMVSGTQLRKGGEIECIICVGHKKNFVVVVY